MDCLDPRVPLFLLMLRKTVLMHCNAGKQHKKVQVGLLHNLIDNLSILSNSDYFHQVIRLVKLVSPPQISQNPKRYLF